MPSAEASSSVSLTHQLVLGLRSYTSLRLLTQIASWAGSVYVVRHVSSHALGEYGIAFVVFSYLGTTYDGTLLEALIQRPPATTEERRAAFTLAAGVGVVLALIAAASSRLVARWAGDAAVAPLMLGIAAALVLTAFCVLPNAVLAREMAFPRLARIGAIQSVCVLVTTVSLAARGAGAWALLAGLIVGAAVRMTLLNAAHWGLTRPTLRLSRALGYVRFGGILLVDNVLRRWYVSLDTILLARWAGTAGLGYYSLAQQTAELPLVKASRVVNDVSLPAYAALREDPSAAAGLLIETIRTHALFGFPLFWGLAATASVLVPVVFGTAWKSAVLPLMALAAVAPLRLIGSVETPAMTGLGRPEVLVRTKAVVAPCMTLALLAGCWFGGIDGAALAWALGFPLCYGFAFRWVLRAAGVSYGQFLTVVRGPISAAALMVGVVGAWVQLSGVWHLPRLAGLVCAIALGALVYTAGLRVIDASGFRLARTRTARLLGLGTA